MELICAEFLNLAREWKWERERDWLNWWSDDAITFITHIHLMHMMRVHNVFEQNLFRVFICNEIMSRFIGFKIVLYYHHKCIHREINRQNGTQRHTAVEWMCEKEKEHELVCHVLLNLDASGLIANTIAQ